MNEFLLNIAPHPSENQNPYIPQHTVEMGAAHKLSIPALPFLFLAQGRTLTPALYTWQQNSACTYPTGKNLGKVSLTWIKKRKDPRDCKTPAKAQLAQLS